jgi:hypothetical protein
MGSGIEEARMRQTGPGRKATTRKGFALKGVMGLFGRLRWRLFFLPLGSIPPDPAAAMKESER